MGLKSRGHPVGGTGLFQLAELYLQLSGRFPNPRAQAADARIALSHSIGGPGNNVYVTLLERADHARERARDLPAPERYARPRADLPVPPQALHGKLGRIEAATTIHVTASGEPPIRIALALDRRRRVFAKIGAAEEPDEALPGRSALFRIDANGDHALELAASTPARARRRRAQER